ncbi:MAG: chromate transporter [Eubacteriaceae bacterium]|nr:chromate transporter [Eubacteriaceae bacterium]
MIYLRLYYEFFKTGLFAIGGGLATLPFLNNMADTTGWFTRGQLADMVAVSESTPGPMGVNMATYVGFTTANIPGAIIATLGLITPSIIIILIIAAFLRAFKNNQYVIAAFYGLRPASTALIAAAGIGVIEIALFNEQNTGNFVSFLQSANIKAIVLAIIIIMLTRFIPQTKKWHPIIFIMISAVVGMIFHFAGV